MPTACLAGFVAATTLATSSVFAADINTSALSQNGWYSDDTRADGTGTQPANTNLRSPTLTAAPENGGGYGATAAHDADIMSQISFALATGTVPLGTHPGAVRLKIDSSGSGKSQISHRKDDGIGFASTAVLSPGFSVAYSWMGDGLSQFSASFKIGIKTPEFGSIPASTRTGENVWDKLLIYEPGNQNPDPNNLSDSLWHSESTTFTTGRWWVVDRTPGNGSTIAAPMTLSSMAGSAVTTNGGRTVGSIWTAITAPGSHITSVQFGIGSGNAGASVYVNQLVTGFYRAGNRTTFGPPLAVQNLNTLEKFTTIQGAINDSDTLDGHVLQMLVNNHVEGPQIQFTKSLTLKGTGIEVIRAGGDTANPYCGCNGRAWILISAGKVCNFQQLEFNGNGYRIADALRFLGSGSVSNCRFREIKFNPSGGEYAGRAVACVGDAPTNITNCDLAQIGRIGMYWYGPAVNTSICEGNRYTGKGAGNWLDYGIEVEGGASITVRGNTITNCTGVATADGSTSGAMLATTFFASGTNVNLNNNTLRDNFLGVGLGYDNSDTTTCTANYNSIVNNDYGIDHTNLTISINAENNWWGDASGPNDQLGTDEASPGTCFPPATMSNTDGAGDPVSDLGVDYCPWLNAPATLSINPVSVCNTGSTVVVKIRMSAVKDFVVGGQFFLQYDNTRLDFVSATPGVFPFTEEIYEIVNEPAGTIDYAVGVLAPNPGTPADTDMVIITFNRIGQACSTANLVSFRAHLPPTRLTNMFGSPIDPLLNSLPAITLDATPPVITCPSNISVHADAGLCTATVIVGNATATDNCTASPGIVGVRSDAQPLNAPYPGNATTTITWTATDSCGNSSQCNQTVTVSGYNEILATVELSPNISPLGSLTRCIRFEAWACPGAVPPVDVMATFTVVAGPPLQPNIATAANVSVLVPCGMNYTCLTARDRLHTLRRTVTMPGGGLSIVGNKYVANFTGDPSSGGDWLIGGNFNDDQYIDILDFGIFVGQSGVTYGSGNTTCSTAYPHADVSGDGVVSPADFTFIQINFLKFHEANCCGAALRMAAGGGAAPSDGSDGGPITRISVKELLRRGFVEAIAGDINHDQWLDTLDVQQFMSGGFPATPNGHR